MQSATSLLPGQKQKCQIFPAMAVVVLSQIYLLERNKNQSSSTSSSTERRLPSIPTAIYAAQKITVS